MYVAGGCIASDCASATNALEIYDTVSDTWSIGTPMPAPRFGAAAGVIGGKLYVTGGSPCYPCVVTNTTIIYDPATNAWSAGASSPASRELAASAVLNGLLYVIGGYDRDSGNPQSLTTHGDVQVYELKDLPAERP